MMEESSGHQDGAINLSTVRDAEQTNGDITRNGENGHDTASSQKLPGKGTPVPALSGAAKRKSKPQADPAAAVAAVMQQTQQQQNLLMLAAQQGLTPQQMQALQQQLMGASSASQHSLLQQQQQQQTLMMHQQQKLHEQALHQLNEQLQLNVLQQSQLLQHGAAAGSAEKNKTGNKLVQQQMQTLALQQQQLMQQIQQQRHYLLAACLVQPFGLSQGMMSPAEIQQLWKEVAAQSGLEENLLKNNINGILSSPTSTVNGQASHLHSPTFAPNGGLPLLDGFPLAGLGPEMINLKQISDGIKPLSLPILSGCEGAGTTTALYRHSLCKWPGCDTQCEDYAAFVKHLNMEHQLDDRSTAQARVQLQVVSQLEIQLTREKELLQAMMQHLHMKPQTSSPLVTSTTSSLSSSSNSSTAATAAAAAVAAAVSSLVLTSSSSTPASLPSLQTSTSKVSSESKTDQHTPILPKHPLITSFPASSFLPSVTMVSSPIIPLPSSHASQSHILLPQPPPHPHGLLPPSSSSTGVSTSGTCGGSSGVGGPIRRRVSDKCNLPISTEIQRNREFYKTTDVRPPFTYASLIRQAIIESPHRQLTLNEIYQWFQATFAYFRRNEATWKNAVRHNLSLHKCFMRVENVKGAVWTVDEIEFYKRRPQKLSGGNIKSPSLNDPSSYNDTINATIRAALGDANLALMAAGGQLIDQDTAQDLSIKSLPNANSHDGLVAMARSLGDEELLMHIKREAGLDPDTPTFLDGPSQLIHRPAIPPNPAMYLHRRQDRDHGSQTQPVVSPNSTSLSQDDRCRYDEQDKTVDNEAIIGRENPEVGLNARVPPEVMEVDAVKDLSRFKSGYSTGNEGSMQGESGDHVIPEDDVEFYRETEDMGDDEAQMNDDAPCSNDEGERQEEDLIEEDEDESLHVEGPQPSLEAEDSQLDNMPVFPVPHLQPVSSS